MNPSKSRHSRESGNPGKNWIPGQARNDKPDNIYVVMHRTMKKTEPESQPLDKAHGKMRMSPFGHLFRFFGWWFGFTGLYAMFAVCPFCAQQGCPIGLASAGTVGAFLTLCVQDWKRFFKFIKRNMTKKQKNS